MWMGQARKKEEVVDKRETVTVWWQWTPYSKSREAAGPGSLQAGPTLPRPLLTSNAPQLAHHSCR